MVCWQIESHGVGGVEDAEPSHDDLKVRGLLMLIPDSDGCSKSREEGVLVDGIRAVGHQGQPAEDDGLAAVLRVLRDMLIKRKHMGLCRPSAGELPTGVAGDVAQGDVVAIDPEVVLREGVEQVDRDPVDDAC